LFLAPDEPEERLARLDALIAQIEEVGQAAEIYRPRLPSRHQVISMPPEAVEGFVKKRD
jgi:hypothetical protein